MLREVKGNTSLSAPHTDCSICLILINGEFYRMDTITVGFFFFLYSLPQRSILNVKSVNFIYIFFPLGLTITLVFLVFEFFSFLAMKPKVLYVIMIELPLKCVRQPVFQIEKKNLNVGKVQEDSEIF